MSDLITRIAQKLYAIENLDSPLAAQNIDANFDALVDIIGDLVSAVNTIAGGGGGGSSPHHILSATHDDTTVASAVDGDLLKRETSTWRRLPIGASGRFLRVVTGLPAWADLDIVATPDTYGDAATVPVITVDQYGRITGVSLAAISGVVAAPHNLLGTIHADTTAASPVLGDLISAQAAAGSLEGALDGWIDGEPGGILQDETDDFGMAGWIDGEPGGSLAAGSSSGSPSWQRLALGAANTFLRSTGTGVEWAAVGLSQYTARAYRSSDVSIAYNTITAIQWQAVSWDTGGFWTGASPTRLTCPSGASGYYLVVAQVQADQGFGSFNVQIYQNGTLIAQTQGGMDNIASGVGDHEPKQTVAVLSVAVADYIEVKVILARTSGAPTTVQGGAAKTFVSIVKVT